MEATSGWKHRALLFTTAATPSHSALCVWTMSSGKQCPYFWEHRCWIINIKHYCVAIKLNLFKIAPSYLKSCLLLFEIMSWNKNAVQLCSDESIKCSELNRLLWQCAAKAQNGAILHTRTNTLKVIARLSWILTLYKSITILLFWQFWAQGYNVITCTCVSWSSSCCSLLSTLCGTSC